MRFVVLLQSDADGSVNGTVQSGQDAATPFWGWLALLRLLEDGLAPVSDPIPAPEAPSTSPVPTHPEGATPC